MGPSTTALIVLLAFCSITSSSGFGFNFLNREPPQQQQRATTTTTAAPPPIARKSNSPTNPAEPHYTFRYVVQDAKTGDYKAQEERRDGAHVRGTYSVAEPNGDLRVVSYSADGDSGFRAEVRVEPAGATSSTPEGRTFSNFFNPFSFFRGEREPPRPVMFDRQIMYDRTAMPAPAPAPAPDRTGLFEQKLPNIQPVYQESAEDIQQLNMYPVYDRTRLLETPAIPITPASTYPLFSKPIVAAEPQLYNKPVEFTGFRLPETPAIPITPSPVVENHGDIITASTPQVKPVLAANRVQMFRRPISTAKPTLMMTPNRFNNPIPTPTPTPAPSPFNIFRFLPSLFSPSVAPTPPAPTPATVQRFQPPQQPVFSPYGTYQRFGGFQPSPPYMLVRTYLVPMTGNFNPAMFNMPVNMQPITEPIIPVSSTIPAKTTPLTVATTTPYQQTETTEAVANSTISVAPITTVGTSAP